MDKDGRMVHSYVSADLGKSLFETLVGLPKVTAAERYVIARPWVRLSAAAMVDFDGYSAIFHSVN